MDAKELTFISGESELTGYESSPGQTKYFCKHCGSPVISRNTSAPNKARVRLDVIQSDIIERPVAHIFITSKANWEVIDGDLPQYETYEPGR